MNDTKPSMQPITTRDGLKPPPRLLLWSVVIVCVLVIAAPFAAIFGFQQVLAPAQQQRVIDQIPFMSNFLAPTPQGGALPTLAPDEAGGVDPSSLLNLQIDPVDDIADEPTVTDEATAEVTTEPEEETPVAAIPPTQTPTPQPASPTPTPTATVTPTLQPASPTPAPAVGGGTANTEAASGLPSSARLFGMVWDQQTWNNCGPATVTTALSYYGWPEDQAYAASYLKPNREDKNVSPYELVDFVNNQTQVRAMWRMGGDLRLLKALIANQFPVIVERGKYFEAYDWLGHYQALVAYDDTQQIFYAYDSFLGTGTAGEGIVEPYNELDAQWREFNRAFIVLYPPDSEGRVLEILGDLADPENAARVAFETAQADAAQNPQDAHAFFNMGTSLVALERYEEAANAFSAARRPDMDALPWRMTWYQFGPFEAYYQTGRYDELLSLVQSNLNNAPEHEESYYWRGRAYEAQGRSGEAAVEYRTALRYNTNFEPAQIALNRQ